LRRREGEVMAWRYDMGFLFRVEMGKRKTKFKGRLVRYSGRGEK
jgi:hypothetical protein